MDQYNIVAIEIASSKIKGAVAAVSPDGKLAVTALEELPAINNVRYGRVQNIREVSAAVNEIIRRLESSPAVAPARIKGLAVALGGRSLGAVPAKAALKFPHECEITENQVQRLMYEATRDFMGDKNIEGMIPRNFYVNNASMRKAVGTFGETLRGEFMMVTCGKETRQNLDRLKFDTIENGNIDYILRPIAVADLVLTADEREIGCVLVDFGAETTTVSVYKDGTLAFLCTIPMGSRLITLDLMTGLGITEEAAENQKITLGSMAEGASTDGDDDEINMYVRARAGEIAANILNQINLSGFNVDSLSKIVLTGGGSKLPEFAERLATLCKIPVRIAEMPSNIIFRVAGANRAENIDIVALLNSAAALGKTFTEAPARPAVAAMTADAPADTVADDETEETDEEERPRTAVDTPATAAAAFNPGRNQPRRPVLDEDDDSILDDDEDDEEEEEEERPRRSFFGFGRKKKKEEPVPVDDDSLEVFDDEDTDDEEDDEDVEADDRRDNDPDHFKGTTHRLSQLRDRFIDMFKGDETDID